MSKDLAVLRHASRLKTKNKKVIAVSLFDIKVAEELILMMIFKNVN